VTDLWTTRDLPVLRALVEHFDDPLANDSGLDLAGDTGLDGDQVERALAALSRADPPYISGTGAWGSRGVPVKIHSVTERAYRAVGAWPTAEGLTDRITAAFADAADAEPDPEQKSKLKSTAAWLGGAGRSVVLDVVMKLVEHQTGLT
jgi:hypothetical protein